MVSLAEVPSTIMLLGIGTVFGVVFINILSSLQDGQTSGSLAYNATGNALSGIAKIFDQYGLIGMIVGFAIVLGVVIALWRAFGTQ